MAHQQVHTLSPGPDSEPVLNLKHQHQFYYYLDGKDSGLRKIRHVYHMYGWTIDYRFRLYVLKGLLEVSRLDTLEIIMSSWLRW